jgi:hypothetical protein
MCFIAALLTMLIPYDPAAFQYLSQLENAHPKFPKKEDILWYMITVGGMIVVRLRPSHAHFPLIPSLVPRISARIVISLPTIAVP